MPDYLKEIIDLQLEFKALEGEKFPPDLKPNGVIEHVRERSRKERELNQAVSGLIRKHIYPFLDNQNQTSEAEAAQLYNFAETLSKRSEEIDVGLAYQIFAALVKWGHMQGNIEYIIKCQYQVGIVLFYLNKELFYDEMMEAFRDGASFVEIYREVKSREARSYINRCIGNVMIMTGIKREGNLEKYYEEIEIAKKHWSNPYLTEFDPDFPWDLYQYSIHQNIVTMMTLLADRPDDAELLRRVCESAEYLYSNKHAVFDRTKASKTEATIDYYLTMSAYHSKKISIDETLSILNEYVTSIQPGAYSENAIYIKTHFTSAYCNLLVMKLGKEAASEEIEKLTHKTLEYCARIPMDFAPTVTNEYLAKFVQNIRIFSHKDLLINAVLRMTVYRHMPTYVHSLMVSWLSEKIAGYFMKTEPSYFIGLFGMTQVDEVLANSAQIHDFVKRCGLVHDIGKITYVNTVSQNFRKLFDMEFEIIRNHPAAGFGMISNEYFVCQEAEVALTHHIWFNGKGGYPSLSDGFTQNCKCVTDIISIADALDAGTDIFGRSYGSKKTLDQIIHEVVNGAGTQFSPKVVVALHDPELYKDLSFIADSRRKDAYYIAYKLNVR